MASNHDRVKSVCSSLPGKDNESRLELAYQKVLLNHEKNENILNKRIVQLEFNLKNVIIERNMLRTKLCKQTGELADLNWRVTHYELSSLKGGKRNNIFDKEQWPHNSRKHIWEYITKYNVPRVYQSQDKRHTSKGIVSNISDSQTTSHTLTHDNLPLINDVNRKNTILPSSTHSSVNTGPQSITAISDTRKSNERRTSFDSACTFEHIDFVSLLPCGMELVRDMSSYRCYIRQSLRKLAIKYTRKNGDRDDADIDDTESKYTFNSSYITHSTIPNLSGNITADTFGTPINAGKSEPDSDSPVIAKAAVPTNNNNAPFDFVNSDCKYTLDNSTPIEFDNIDAVTNQPQHLINMDLTKGMIKALHYYQEMLEAIVSTINAFQAHLTDLKSVTSLMKANQNENIKLRDFLDRTVSGKDFINAAPEELIVSLNKILRCPIWQNDTIYNIDDSIFYPTGNTLSSTRQNNSEMDDLRNSLVEQANLRTSLEQVLEDTKTQIHDLEHKNAQLTERDTHFDNTIAALKTEHEEEISAKSLAVSSLESQCKELAAQNETLKCHIESLNTDIGIKQHTIINHDVNLARAEKTIQHLQSEIQSLTDFNTKIQESFKASSEDSETRVHILSNKLSMIGADNEVHHKNLSELSHKLSEKEEELTIANQTIMDAMNLIMKSNFYTKHLLDLTSGENVNTQEKSQIPTLYDISTDSPPKKDVLQTFANYISNIEHVKMKFCELNNELTTRSTCLSEVSQNTYKIMSELEEKDKIIEKLNNDINTLQDESNKKLKNFRLAEELLETSTREFMIRNKEHKMKESMLLEKLRGSNALADANALIINDMKSTYEDLLKSKTENNEHLHNAKKIINYMTSKYKKLVLASRVISSRLNDIDSNNGVIVGRVIPSLETQMDTIKKSHTDLNSIVMSVITRIESLNNDCAKARRFIGESCQDNKEVKNKMNEVVQNYIDVKESLMSLKTCSDILANEQQKKLEELNSLISSKDSLLDDLNTQLGALEKEKIEMGAEIDRLNENQNQLKQTLTRLQAEKYQLNLTNREKNKQLESRLIDSNNKCEQLTLDLEKSLNQENDLRENLEFIREESSSAKDKMTKEMRELEDKSFKQVQELNDKIGTLLKLKENTETRLREMGEKAAYDVQILKDDFSRDMLQLKSVSAEEIKQLNNRIQELSSLRDDAIRNTQKLNDTLIRNQNQYDSKICELIQDYQNSINKLEEELGGLRDEHKNLLSVVSELKESNVSLTNLFNATSLERDTLRDELSTLTSDFHLSKKHVQKISSELNAISDEKALAHQAYEKTVSKITEKLKHTTSMLEESEKKINEMTKYLDQLTEERQKYLQDCSVQSDKAKKLEHKLMSFVDNSRLQYETLSEDFVKAKSSLIIAQNEIKRLTENNENLALALKLEKEKFFAYEGIFNTYGTNIGEYLGTIKFDLVKKEGEIKALKEEIENLNSQIKTYEDSLSPEKLNLNLHNYSKDELSRLRAEIASLRFEKHRNIFVMNQNVVQLKGRIAELERKLIENFRRTSIGGLSESNNS